MKLYTLVSCLILIAYSNANAEKKAVNNASCQLMSNYAADILSLRLADISDTNIYRVLQNEKEQANATNLLNIPLKNKIVEGVYNINLQELEVSIDSNEQKKESVINKIKQGISFQCMSGTYDFDSDNSKLDFSSVGLNNIVDIEPVLAPASDPGTELEVQKSPQSQHYYIQVGSFSYKKPNQALLKSISDKGFDYTLHEEPDNKNQQYKILIGPFPTRDRASGHLRFVREQIKEDAFLHVINN
ncbi:MAG: SPOR domain-containing protein [Gammaproteobacteria bacterium]|nr:SPOR domain-containing protein [Gammaproteobacteria bacterium]